MVRQILSWGSLYTGFLSLNVLVYIARNTWKRWRVQWWVKLEENAFCFQNLLLWFICCIVTQWEVSEELVSCFIHPQCNGKIPPHFCKISVLTVCHTHSIPLKVMEQDCPRSCFQLLECILHLEEQEYMSCLSQAEVWTQVCSDSREWLDRNPASITFSYSKGNKISHLPLNAIYHKAEPGYSLSDISLVYPWRIHSKQSHCYFLARAIQLRGRRTHTQIPDGQKFDSVFCHFCLLYYCFIVFSEPLYY